MRLQLRRFRPPVGGPNARAETGRPGTSPRPAAPKPTELSGHMGDARASHCIHPDLPRVGNAPAQLNWVRNEGTTSRINSAAAYSKANRDSSAMAAGSHGDHVPVSVELGRKRGRSGTDDCESGPQSERPHTIANHGRTHAFVVANRQVAPFCEYAAERRFRRPTQRPLHWLQ